MGLSDQAYVDLTSHVMDRVALAAADVAALVEDTDESEDMRTRVLGLYTSGMAALLIIALQVIDHYSDRRQPMSDAECLQAANVVLATALKKYTFYKAAAKTEQRKSDHAAHR